MAKQVYEDEIERISNDRGKLRKDLDQAKETITSFIKEKNNFIIKFENEKNELLNEIDKLVFEKTELMKKKNDEERNDVITFNLIKLIYLHIKYN